MSESRGIPQAGNSGTLSTETPRKRKDKFTDREVHVLVDTILEHIDQLFGPHPSNAAGKNLIWHKVMEKVNREGDTKRTLQECKKKWQDYKRKVKNYVDTAMSQDSQPGNMTMAEIPRRYKIIATFFNWFTEGNTSTQLFNKSLLDKDINWDSEEDFVQKEDTASPDCCIVDGPENVCVPHSSDEVSKQLFDHTTKTLGERIQQSPDVSKQAVEHHKASESKECIYSTAEAARQATKHQAQSSKEINEPSSTMLSLQPSPSWDSKLDQLIAQQQQTNKILIILQKNVCESLKLQKRMNRMLKTNFLELQKSIISNQNTSSEQSGSLEQKIKSLATTINEINNHLRVKKLQESMCSDESDLDTGTSHILSTPLNKKSTPGKKRKLKKTLPSSGLLKKKPKEK
ncbi:uncharacterized protein [Pyxicephalus adspersus]